MRLSPTLWPSLAAALLIPAGVALGLWQLDRAEEKRVLYEAFERDGEPMAIGDLPGAGADDLYRPVVGQGRYLADRQVLVDNINRGGQPGLFVLTPFQPDIGGPLVLVNRGWVPAPAFRDERPEVAVSDQDRTLRGRLARLPQPAIRLGRDPQALERGAWPRVTVYPEFDRIAAALDRELVPWTIWLDPDQPDGYRRDFSPAAYGPARHLAYAVQWFALALMTFIYWIWSATRRREDP